MPLVDLPLPSNPAPPPRDVRAFLREARRRIARFQRDHHLPAFMPSDFAANYAALAFVESEGLCPGHWLCEWGSGFGVTACLAAMLGFDAWGIEIEEDLVEAARELADDFGLPVTFVHGSFLPADYNIEESASLSWLNVTEAPALGPDGEGLATDDFDVIFAYPWPDEEELTEELFERYARRGAVLLSSHEVGGLRLRQSDPSPQPPPRRGEGEQDHR